jgi:hypothetical protein
MRSGGHWIRRNGLARNADSLVVGEHLFVMVVFQVSNIFQKETHLTCRCILGGRVRISRSRKPRKDRMVRLDYALHREMEICMLDHQSLMDRWKKRWNNGSNIIKLLIGCIKEDHSLMERWKKRWNNGSNIIKLLIGCIKEDHSLRIVGGEARLMREVCRMDLLLSHDDASKILEQEGDHFVPQVRFQNHSIRTQRQGRIHWKIVNDADMNSKSIHLLLGDGFQPIHPNHSASRRQ